MELRQYLTVIGKWIWLVVLCVAVAAVSSYLVSRAATRVYATKTTMMVGRVTQLPDPNSGDFRTGEQLAFTYAQLARREPVLQGVIESLGLKMNWKVLANQVTTNAVPQTQLLEISVVDSDPYRAKVLADAIAQQLILQSPSSSNTANLEQLAFSREQLDDLILKIETSQQELLRLKQELDAANSSRQIQDLQSQISILDTKISNWQNTYSQLLISLQGGDINNLSVIEEAAVPTRPVGPNVLRNVLLASAIGLILAISGAFLIEYLDDTLKTSQDLERLGSLPTLGILPHIEGKETPEKLITVHQPLSPVVEDYRLLRAHLQYSVLEQPVQTLMITSSGPSEGKSVTIANLAVVMAQAGLKVILVDTDLRQPQLHTIFRLPNRHGLSDILLTADPSLEGRLRETEVKNLRLLTSGPIPPNPAEILGSIQMKAVIERLRAEADIVLFDSPPALILADATILGTQVDGAILVIDSGRTRREEANRAVANLQRVRVNIYGFILNRAGTTGRSYYTQSDPGQSGPKSGLKPLIKQSDALSQPSRPAADKPR